MKKGYKILLILSISLLFLYYVISLFLMNNNPHVLHYYGYENFKEAKQKKAIINADVDYILKGFSIGQEKLIRKNIFIYTTKSNYEEFFGFLIRFDCEDKKMLRLNLESNKDIDLLPSFLINKELRFKNKYEGSLTYTSFDLFRKEKSVTLDVMDYQNHQPVKLGEIIVNLN